MPTYTFFPNIPQPTDDPSVSQAQLLQNFQSIRDWNETDHYAFGTGNDGWHKQLNFPAVGTLPSFTGFQSGVVTAAGTASPTSAQIFFKNSESTYPLSSIRAFGVVTVAGSLVSGYGVASISHPSTGSYSITLNSGILS